MMDNPNIHHTVYRMTGAIEMIGVGRALGLEIHPNRVLPYWVFAVVTGGAAHMRIGEDREIVPVSHYFLLPPHIRHDGTARNTFDTVWFHFSMEAETVDPTASPSGFDVPIYGAMPPELNYLAWGTLVKRQIDDGYCPVGDAVAQITALLGLAAMAHRRQFSAHSSDLALVQQVLDVLARDYAHDLTSESIADAVGYSYGHVERVFRRSQGMTIQQKLMQVRISEAISLLSMGQTIKATAHAVGYRDYYYFLRVFKKVTNTTPTHIRRGM